MTINPFRAMAKAQRLTRAGRPLLALLALQKLVTPPKPKRKARPKPKAKHAKSPVTRKAPASPQPRRPKPGTFEAGRFESPHGPLAYKIYTPIGSARRRMPLVVMLHGCGQSAGDFAVGTGMNRLADEMGFLVLYPEQSPSANFGRCWNWHRAGDQQRDAGEPAAIAALVRHMASLCKANPARIYIAGMSAGAATAAITAAAYPELFAALGVHSGLIAGTVTTLSGALAAMRDGAGGTKAGGARRPPLPTIVFHGDHDRTVNPANARGFVDRLWDSRKQPIVKKEERGRSAGGRDYTRTAYAHAAGPVMLEDWVIHRSGHAWSGGHRAGSHTDPAGPDASREMVRFFLARRRSVLAKRARI